MVRVPSWANSLVLNGVRIHALWAAEAKANGFASRRVVVSCANTQAQQGRSEEVCNLLVLVPSAIGCPGNGEWFKF